MASGLAHLVMELLLAAEGLTGYQRPAEPPTVVLTSHEALERAACTGPCPVLGWFDNRHTIYLDDRLDPTGDLRAQSILLHELVHYLQREAGAFPDQPGCEAWASREREAYLVQARWLARQGVEGSVLPGGRAPWVGGCAAAPQRSR